MTATRKRLPDTRKSITHKFSVGGHEGYLTVGLFDDDTPGEIFIVIAKEGSTLSGAMECFAIAISMGLQYGVPLSDFVRKFKNTRFDPSGFTPNPDIRIAKSMMDYIFRWMELRFLPDQVVEDEPKKTPAQDGPMMPIESDGPPCKHCGGITKQSGSCYTCTTCGETTGCS